ncbi:MAG TPA: hypothetical protein VIX42_10975 [Edaphobacter sp.]
MKRYWSVVLLFLMMTGLAGIARAQVGIYGAFTTGKLNTPNTPWLYGGTGGIYKDHGHGLVALGFDARGEFLHQGGNAGSGSDTTLGSGLVGIRFAVTPHVLPLKPYAEGLIGVGHIAVGEGFARTSSTNFEYKVLGGMDYTFFPRLDWRVVEFGYTGLANHDLDVRTKTLSTGLVFRLPFVR